MSDGRKFAEQVKGYRMDLACSIEQEIHHIADQTKVAVWLWDREINDDSVVWKIKDDPVQVELIRDALAPLGYRVLVAELYGHLSVIVS